MNKTTIEWTDYTWNPVTGCNKISAGCRSCYAETIATRFWGKRKFTDVQMHPERLSEPNKMGIKLHGKKVFVCDVSDLFHDDVSFEFIDDVFAQILACYDTTFQILTKRLQRALEYFERNEFVWPFDNLWIGVSCENQEQADKRIPVLLQIPAAVRFLSCEPLIGPIDLSCIAPETPGNRLGSINCLTGEENGFYSANKLYNKIDWVIAGGESGHNARPMHPDWVRTLRDQCASVNVPFFFKQWGAYVPWVDQSTTKKVWLDDYYAMIKVGKSKSGNMLDGKQHLEFPNLQS